MRTIAAGLLAMVFGCAMAAGDKKQTDNRVPVKLPIHHADPWAVKAMLEGTNLTQPEISTLWGVQGAPRNGGGAGQQGGGSPLLKNGYLVVNPTDNSLWWYPKKS